MEKRVSNLVFLRPVNQDGYIKAIKKQTLLFGFLLKQKQDKIQF